MASTNDTRSPTTSHCGDHPCRVLLAESDDDMRKVLTWCLRDEGYEVIPCACGNELLEHLHRYLPPESETPFEIIVSDIRMPGTPELETLEAASRLDGFPPLILLAAFGAEEIDEQARRLGVTTLSAYPVEVEELVAAIRRLLPIPVHVSR